VPRRGNPIVRRRRQRRDTRHLIGPRESLLARKGLSQTTNRPQTPAFWG
jgi:hypothetical protein